MIPQGRLSVKLLSVKVVQCGGGTIISFRPVPSGTPEHYRRYFRPDFSDMRKYPIVECLVNRNSVILHLHRPPLHQVGSATLRADSAAVRAAQIRGFWNEKECEPQPYQERNTGDHEDRSRNLPDSGRQQARGTSSSEQTAIDQQGARRDNAGGRALAPGHTESIATILTTHAVNPRWLLVAGSW